MLYNGKKLIQEAIKKDAQKKALIQSFGKKIFESPSLTLEFSVNKDIEKYAGKLSLEEANAFAGYLKGKYENQLKETTYDFKAKKDLFEAFGVADKVTSSIYDEVIDFSAKSLNESTIVSIVHDKNYDENQKKKVQVIRESKVAKYQEILNNNKDRNSLRFRLGILEDISANLDEKNAEMIQESINTIRGKVYTDFKKAVNDTLRLDTLTEFLLLNSKKRTLKEDFEQEEEEASQNQFKGRKAKFGDIGILKNVIVEYGVGSNSFMIVNFSVTVYPAEPFYRDRLYEIKEIKNRIGKLGRTISLTIKNEMPGAFEGDSKINVAAREQFMDKEWDKIGRQVDAKVEMMMYGTDDLTADRIASELPTALEKVSALIADKIPDLLSKDVQEAEYAKAAEQGSKRGAPKDRGYDPKDTVKNRNTSNDKFDDWAASFLFDPNSDDGKDD